MLLIIYAFLNSTIFLQLLYITLVTKKIQNVYNTAVTIATMVSKIRATLIFPLYLGCTKIRDAKPESQ